MKIVCKTAKRQFNIVQSSSKLFNIVLLLRVYAAKVVKNLQSCKFFLGEK